MTQVSKPNVLNACRFALRPVVRMLLKHGVMHKDFVELSKEVYVDVARTEYGLGGRPTNVSRMALLTGLDRKEIARVKSKLEQAPPEVPTSLSEQDRIARVLSGWYQDPDYLTADGKPLIVPLAGPAPSYEDLVKRYGGDVPAVTILRELKRTAAVRVAAGDVEVLRRNYRLDTVDAEALDRAGSVLADLGRTVMHNLYREPAESSRFEARATNSSIPRAALKAYRELIYREAQAFLEKIDAWLSRHEVAPGKRRDLERVGIGMYWIQSPPPSPAVEAKS